jgi:hypothetical protein
MIEIALMMEAVHTSETPVYFETNTKFRTKYRIQSRY